MYSCPACGAENASSLAICQCGADLTLLRRIDVIADVWFNSGLDALREGAPGKALEWFSACCAARPTDAAARRAQARVWAQLGCWKEAREAAERSAEIEPDSPDLQLIRRALDEASVPKRKHKKKQKRKNKRKTAHS